MTFCGVNMKPDTCPIAWLPKLLSGMGKEELWERFGVLATVLDDGNSLAVVRGTLRIFTSEWVDSGFAEDGSEYPFRRNFAPKMGATAPTDAAADGSNRRAERALRVPHAVRAMAKCVNGKLRVTGPRGDIKYVVFPDNTSFSYGKPPQMYIEPRGGFRYERAIDLPQYGRSCKEGITEGQETKDRKEYLEILAATLFMEFYQSEWRFRLMRCRRCGVFVIARRKPRERYKYGWHCAMCRSAGTASARMLAVTKQHRLRWLSFAAEASLRWRPENGERSVWIAEQVNKRLWRTEPRIRRNSITHNAATIAQMAEELGLVAATGGTAE